VLLNRPDKISRGNEQEEKNRVNRIKEREKKKKKERKGTRTPYANELTNSLL